MEPVVTSTSAALVDLINGAFAAGGAGAWPVLIGLILAIVAKVVLNFGLADKLSGWAQLGVMAGIAVVSSVAAGLIMSLSWVAIVSTSLIAGLSALGGVKALDKLLTKKAA